MNNTNNYIQTFSPGAMLWASANTAVKISILDLYIYIFPTRKFRIAAYITMGLTGAYLVTIILESLLICRPLAYIWDKNMNGTCGNEILAFLTAGILNLVLDITIIILPMPMLWGLQLPTAKKLSLTIIFGVGAAYVHSTTSTTFSSSSSCLSHSMRDANRTFYRKLSICVITILRIKTLYDLDLTDITYSVAQMAMWSSLEPLLGIISACLPVIYPALRDLCAHKVFAWQDSSTNSDRSCHPWRRGHGESGGAQATTKSFQRLDDHTFPLRDGCGISNKIAGPGGGDDESKLCFDGARGVEAENSIVVTRGWGVHAV